MKRQWYAGLDGLRAIAFLLVFCVHIPPPFIPQPTGGYVGVDLFFVLSGFLITEILLREHAQYGRIDLRRFYLRRSVRLLPAVVLFVVVVSIWVLVDARLRDVATSVQLHGLAALSYLYNWVAIFSTNEGKDPRFIGPLWSLSVEEQFYLVWPAVLLLVLGRARRTGEASATRSPDGTHPPGSLRRLMFVTTVAIVVSNAVRFTIGVVLEDSNSYFRAMWGTDVCAGAMLIGALVAMIRASEPGWYAQVKQWSRRLTPVALVGAGLVAFRLPAAPNPLPFAGVLLMFHLCSAVVIIACVERSSRVVRSVCEFPALRWIGRISYGAYVVHFFLIYRFGTSFRFAAPSLLIVTLAVAASSFYLVEQPLAKKLRARWNLDAKPVPVVDDGPRPSPLGHDAALGPDQLAASRRRA